MFDVELKNRISIGDVTIYNENGRLVFAIDEKFYLTDDRNYITGYCKLVTILNYDSILIGGLGFGILPYFMENFNYIETIDVVEKNKNVIDAINELNHLHHTRIIHHDFITYKPDRKYDLIVADLWWLRTDVDDFESEKNNIISNYSGYLNEGGKIYFPILDSIF